MSWHVSPDVFRGLAGVDLAALGIPEEAAFVRAYCARTGRESIGNWDFYLAFNLFRLAAILQGIAGRARDGTAAGADAVGVGRAARPLAELGWSRVRRRAA
jgi:aminoglycoside phosphotransferase (APT) family kinase protein